MRSMVEGLSVVASPSTAFRGPLPIACGDREESRVSKLALRDPAPPPAAIGASTPLRLFEHGRTILERRNRRPAKGQVMTEDDKSRSEADAEIEREIRLGRKFSAKDAMALMAGPGAMKGASPVSRMQQAEIEIGTWLGNNLSDDGGALRVVLLRHLKGSKLLADNLDRPLVALAEYCRSLLATDYLLREIVREADTEWGRAMDERPYLRAGRRPAASRRSLYCRGCSKEIERRSGAIGRGRTARRSPPFLPVSVAHGEGDHAKHGGGACGLSTPLHRVPRSPSPSPSATGRKRAGLSSFRDPAPHRRAVRPDPPDIPEILMDHRSRPCAAELLDDVGHGVAVADDQGRIRPRPDPRDQGRRVGRIVDHRNQPQPCRQRRRGLAGAPVVADIDDCRRILREPVGEQGRLPVPLGGEVRIALALRRVQVADDVEDRPGGGAGAGVVVQAAARARKASAIRRIRVMYCLSLVDLPGTGGGPQWGCITPKNRLTPPRTTRPRVEDGRQDRAPQPAGALTSRSGAGCPARRRSRLQPYRHSGGGQRRASGRRRGRGRHPSALLHPDPRPRRRRQGGRAVGSAPRSRHAAADAARHADGPGLRRPALPRPAPGQDQLLHEGDRRGGGGGGGRPRARRGRHVLPDLPPAGHPDRARLSARPR